MNDNGVSEFKQLVNREFDALTARVAELERERDEALHHAKLSESHYQSLARDVDAGMLHDRDWERERRTLQAKVRELEAAAEELESDHEQRCEWLQKAEYVRDAARESNVANFNKAIELSRELASMRDERDAARANYIDLEQQLQVVQRDHGIALVDLKAMEEMRDAARAKAEAFQKEVENCKASSAVFNPQQSPDGLSAILRELREERIYGAIEFDKYGMNAIIKCIGDFDHSRSCETYEDVAANLTRLAIQYHPDSSFARRRAAVEKPEQYPLPWDLLKWKDTAVSPIVIAANGQMVASFDGRDLDAAKLIVAAVNAYQPTPAEPTPEPASLSTLDEMLHDSHMRALVEKMANDRTDEFYGCTRVLGEYLSTLIQREPSVPPAPAAADPARELLDAGEWSVKSEPYSSAYCVMAGNEFFCHCTNDDLDQFVALCAIVNRYRAIEAAVNGSSFVRETIMSNLGGSTWKSLHAALRPLLRTSAKEA